MSIYTNTGLVTHAENALNLKTKYMWGGILREITDAYIKQMMRMWGVNASIGYSVQRWKDLQALAGQGYFGVDCVGLIKSYYWSGKPNGGTGSPRYDSNTDVNAKTMFQRATVKGKIKDIPETPGLIVYSSAPVHVGIYVGQGLTIESTLGSRGDGVVKRQLDNLWTDWFECPYIEYPKLKAVKLAFNATIRSAPTTKAQKLGTLAAGSKCVIVDGSDVTDPASKYVYVRLAGKDSQWIVKSAIA
jgi:hypothetical protein